MFTNSTGAKVILAGAGPGDPDLITVKAANYLQQADVVLVDRLVSRVILDRYVRPSATIVEVGKQCRRGISTPQQTINELMVAYAAEGKFVVRLKGGDLSFFSNVLDELQALADNGIPYEMVPGITAASGAAAYAGFPLTARDHATAVRFLTCYKSTIVSDEYWKELAATGDTLVFYMSSETIAHLVERLVDAGISKDTKMAVIEQATTTYQHIYISDIHEYDMTAHPAAFLSPSLIIIGKVVELHNEFGWFRESGLRDYYFKPLSNPLTERSETKNSLLYAG